MTSAARRWTWFLLLLVAEGELLIPTHYQIRTHVRALMPLPLYHILLAFFAFSVLVRLVAGERLPALEDVPVSRPFLALHLAWYLLVLSCLTPLWDYTASCSSGVCSTIWFMVLAVYGVTWLAAVLPMRLWGTSLRAHGPWMAGAMLAGGVSVFLSRASDLLWRHLASGTFYLSDKLLRLWFPDTVVDVPSLTIGTPTFAVQIANGCSGYEGMGLIAMFGIAYIVLRRHELDLRRAVWIVPGTMGIIWVANSLRIALIVTLGTLISPQVAVRGFHSQAGWLSFSVIGIGLVLLVEKLHWFRKTRVPGQQAEYPSLVFVVPLLSLILARMISQAFSIDFDIFYPVRTLFVAWVLFCFWEQWYPLVRAVSWRYACVVGLAVYVYWIVLVPGANDSALDPSRSLASPWTEIWLAARVLGAVVIVPVVEELAFRGFLLRRLQSAVFDTVAVGHITLVSLVGSSLCFGILHGDSLRTWAAGTGAGLAYALATRRGGRLGDAVAAHGVTNLCLAIQVLVLHQWSLWS